MGSLPNGILGPFIGKVGPAVGTTWRDIPVIRSSPPRKRGKTSDGQRRQMSRFALMSSFLSPLTDLLNRVYNKGMRRMSSFNNSLSYNVRNAVTGEYPEFTVSYARLQLGIGILLNPDTISSLSDQKGMLEIRWTDNSGEGSARATDKAFVAVYCEALSRWVTSVARSQRNAASYILEVAQFSGKAVHTYIGFLSADEDFVSTSRYAGMVNIL